MDVSFELPTTIDAAPLARSRLLGLGDVLSPAVHVDLLLVVSELVTNAIRHGPGKTVSVRVRAEGPGHVHGEVVDGGDGRVPSTTDPGTDGGWGLQLVDAIVTRWGVAHGSTHVWFEIVRP